MGWGTVGRILANPLYLGKVRHKGEVFDGRHEAIVDEALFNRATTTRTNPARKMSGRR